MLKELVAPAKAADDAAEPSSRPHQPFPDAHKRHDPFDAPAETRSRLAERRVARGLPSVKHEEPHGWQEGPSDGEPVEMDDPLADW